MHHQTEHVSLASHHGVPYTLLGFPTKQFASNRVSFLILLTNLLTASKKYHAGRWKPRVKDRQRIIHSISFTRSQPHLTWRNSGLFFDEKPASCGLFCGLVLFCAGKERVWTWDCGLGVQLRLASAGESERADVRDDARFLALLPGAALMDWVS